MRAAHSACQREDALGQGGIHKPKTNPWAKASGTDLSGADLESENQCKITPGRQLAARVREQRDISVSRKGKVRKLLICTGKAKKLHSGWRAVLRAISSFAEMVLPPLLLQALSEHPRKPQRDLFSDLQPSKLLKESTEKQQPYNPPRAREDKGSFIQRLPTARQSHSA